VDSEDVRRVVDGELLAGVDELLAALALVLVLPAQVVRLDQHAERRPERRQVVDVHREVEKGVEGVRVVAALQAGNAGPELAGKEPMN
jgi:hypothetical protein